MLPKTEEIMHVALCQAASILNVSPEMAKLEDGRRIRDILRTALADYANAVMGEPVRVDGGNDELPLWHWAVAPLAAKLGNRATHSACSEN